MTFPAWFEFNEDSTMQGHGAAQRVYAKLIARPKSFYEPQDVKVWLYAQQLVCKRDTIISALNLLVAHGYLIEHGRGDKNVRRFTVVTSRASSPPERTHPPAP